MISAFGIDHGEGISKAMWGPVPASFSGSEMSRGLKLLKRKPKAKPSFPKDKGSIRRGISAGDYEDGVMHVPDSLKGM